MQKKLILVAAPPACGKTTVSQHICKELRHVAYFDKDDYSELIGLIFDLTGNKRDLDGDFYRKNVKDVQYETLFHQARVSLQYEDLVLVNAPFAKEVRSPELLRKLKEDLHSSGTSLYVVWVLASPEQCHERMLGRGLERDAGKLAGWEHFVQTLDFSVPELKECEAVDELLVVDTTSPQTYEKTVKEAVRKIGEIK